MLDAVASSSEKGLSDLLSSGREMTMDEFARIRFQASYPVWKENVKKVLEIKIGKENIEGEVPESFLETIWKRRLDPDPGEKDVDFGETSILVTQQMKKEFFDEIFKSQFLKKIDTDVKSIKNKFKAINELLRDGCNEVSIIEMGYTEEDIQKAEQLPTVTQQELEKGLKKLGYNEKDIEDYKEFKKLTTVRFLESDTVKEVSKTGAYLAENYKILTHFANDVAEQITGEEGNIIEESSVKTLASVAHAGFSVLNAYANRDVKPVINTVLFNTKEHTDFLKSDNAFVQCGIDIATSTVSSLVTFNLFNAGIGAGITVSKCAIKYFQGEESILLPILDAADAVNDFANASNYLIQAVELIKLGYITMDSLIPYIVEENYEYSVDLEYQNDDALSTKVSIDDVKEGL